MLQTCQQHAGNLQDHQQHQGRQVNAAWLRQSVSNRRQPRLYQSRQKHHAAAIGLHPRQDGIQQNNDAKARYQPVQDAEQTGHQNTQKSRLCACEHPHGSHMAQFHQPCRDQTGRIQAPNGWQKAPERHHHPVGHSKDKAPNGVLKRQALPLHHQPHEAGAAHQTGGNIQDQIDNL